MDEWTLPYVYRPQISKKIESSSSSGPARFQLQFDSIYMRVLFDLKQHRSTKQIEFIKQFSIKSNWGLGFFQTDKQIYKHSEMVRFRFLRLNESSLTPLDDHCQLTIKVSFKLC